MLRLLPERDDPPLPTSPDGEGHPLFSPSRRAFQVLVVDDDAAKRYALSRALRVAGFLVTEAAHGADALTAVAGCAAAVLDVYLPDMDGFALCRQMRQTHPALAIVQVSSVLVEEPYRQAGREAGADAYLSEPEMGELVRTLDGLLQARGGVQ